MRSIQRNANMQIYIQTYEREKFYLLSVQNSIVKVFVYQ